MLNLFIYLQLVINVHLQRDKNASVNYLVMSVTLVLIDAWYRLSLDKRKPSLDVAYRFYDNDGCGLTNEQRRSALEHVVLHMLQSADNSTVTEFFSDHISSIMACIETPRTARVSQSLLTVYSMLLLSPRM